MRRAAADSRHRCAWVRGGSALELAYHDSEWGVPSFDDRHLFEMLVLEGAQAGLSWSTILHKREGYRRAFADFDPARVARFDARRRARLLRDPGIVRHAGKIEAAVANARCVLEVQQEVGSLAALVWSVVDGTPLRRRRHSARHVPAESPASRALGRELRRRGFRFVGATTCYAFMQGVGMVNDHLVTCFRWAEVDARARRARLPGAAHSRRPTAAAARREGR